MDDLDEMDVLYDIAYPPYSNWLQDLFSFAELDNPQMDDTLKAMDKCTINSAIFLPLVAPLK